MSVRYTHSDMTPAEVIAEVDWLLQGNVHPELIAQTLGRSMVSLESAARRLGRNDLSNQFNRIIKRDRPHRVAA